MRILAIFLLAGTAIAGPAISGEDLGEDFGAALSQLHQTTDYASPGSWTYAIQGAMLVETVSNFITDQNWTNHHHLCDFDTSAEAVTQEIDMTVVEDQRHAFLFFQLLPEVKRAHADGLAGAALAVTAIWEGDDNIPPDGEYRALAEKVRSGAFGPVVARNYSESSKVLGDLQYYEFEPLFEMRLIARAEHADQVIALVDAARVAGCGG